MRQKRRVDEFEAVNIGRKQCVDEFNAMDIRPHSVSTSSKPSTSSEHGVSTISKPSTSSKNSVSTSSKLSTSGKTLCRQVRTRRHRAKRRVDAFEIVDMRPWAQPARQPDDHHHLSPGGGDRGHKQLFIPTITTTSAQAVLTVDAIGSPNDHHHLSPGGGDRGSKQLTTPKTTSP